jgi:hypothetical protein
MMPMTRPFITSRNPTTRSLLLVFKDGGNSLRPFRSIVRHRWRNMPHAFPPTQKANDLAALALSATGIL